MDGRMEEVFVGDGDRLGGCLKRDRYVVFLAYQILHNYLIVSIFFHNVIEFKKL
jgi:hypothetical protein